MAPSKADVARDIKLTEDELAVLFDLLAALRRAERAFSHEAGASSKFAIWGMYVETQIKSGQDLLKKLKEYQEKLNEE